MYYLSDGLLNWQLMQSCTFWMERAILRQVCYHSEGGDLNIYIIKEKLDKSSFKISKDKSRSQTAHLWGKLMP